MKKYRWFLHFLWRSISQRRLRIFIASISVTLAVAVITGMMGLSSGIKEKLGKELKAYGANIIITSDTGYISEDDIGKLKVLGNRITDFTRQIYGHAEVSDSIVELIGVEFNRLREQGWRITGSWPDSEEEAVLGSSLKKALNLNIGDTFKIKTENSERHFILTGYIDRGTTEDRAAFISISDAQQVFNQDSRVSTILVRGSGKTEALAREMGSLLPHLKVKSLRQVAYAEESILNKIQLLMIFVTLIVLAASVISVGSTMGATVIERRAEIGLMKAIGGTKKGIALFYIAETALVGLAGGITGLLAGFLSSQAVSLGAFDSYINFPVYIVFIAPVLGMLISMPSGYFPVSNSLKPAASAILRGE